MEDQREGKRKSLIGAIEKARNSKVICYLTSMRQNVPAQMSEDAVRQIMDLLEPIKRRPIRRLDLFLCSNGGNSVVPWRLVALFREYAKEFNVLIPYRAYSAATILSLGADNIIMHPFAELGPIDPTVSNDFNPQDPATNRRLGISVEDVKAYITFVKSTVGITHEDELVKALEILANNVHPLALGNVERFLSQSRMMGRKILKTHMPEDRHDHVINEIIENLASRLFFHGHPINRKEAREQLQLKVEYPSSKLERLLWDLYLLYEEDFEARRPFNPMAALNSAKIQKPPAHQISIQPEPAEIDPVTPSGAETLPQAGMELPVNVQVAHAQLPATTTIDCSLRHAVIEDATTTRWYQSKRRFIEMQVGPQPAIREELYEEGWSR